LDPEDLREIISNYQKCVAETVGRFDGFVAKYTWVGGTTNYKMPLPPLRAADRSQS
jgi:hypothetical protein